MDEFELKTQEESKGFSRRLSIYGLIIWIATMGCWFFFRKYLGLFLAVVAIPLVLETVRVLNGQGILLAELRDRTKDLNHRLDKIETR